MELYAYVASPLGFSEAGKYFYYETLIPMIASVGFRVLDPWVLTDSALIRSAIDTPEGPAQKKRWVEVNKIIGRNNDEAIKRSAIVVAVLDGSDVDSGTAAEIGAAATLGKLVIGYRNDLRQSADNVGAIVNLQVEYYIRKNGGDIVTTLTDLQKTLHTAHRRLS